MNRLHQLKSTLLKNISDNEDYEELEFILLDYNSNDEMCQWVKDTLGVYIKSNRIIYFKTFEPDIFSHSHSKNVAFKLASGDIICNINADHYTGFSFANYVNSRFVEHGNIVLTPIDYHNTKLRDQPPKDIFGKGCVKKKDFDFVRGFDEGMNGYGFEDWDFINRLELSGVKRMLIEDMSFLQYVNHDDAERYSLNFDTIFKICVRHISPSKSELLILYCDGKFEWGRVIDNSSVNSEDYYYSFTARDYRFEYSLDEFGWKLGRWTESTNGNLILSELHGKIDYPLKKAGDKNYESFNGDPEHKRFIVISDYKTKQGLVKFKYLYYNRSIMEENLRNKRIVVNESFGKATVFRNFKNEPLSI